MVVVVVLFVAIVSAGGYASFYDKLMKHDKVKTNKAIGFFKKSKVSEDNLNSIIQLVHIAAPGKCTANEGGNVVYCVEQRKTKKRFFLSHHCRCFSSKLKSGVLTCVCFLCLSRSLSTVVNLPQFCVAMHLIRYSMKGTPMPQVLPNKLALLLKSAAEVATPKKKKKKKKAGTYASCPNCSMYFCSCPLRASMHCTSDLLCSLLLLSVHVVYTLGSSERI